MAASKQAKRTLVLEAERVDICWQRVFQMCYGGEFARNRFLKDDIATNFSDAACASWQMGGMENMNGRIRRCLPRSANLDALIDEDILDISMKLNLTPRKCLGTKSPAEAFLNALGKDLRIRFIAPVALRGQIYPRLV